MQPPRQAINGQARGILPNEPFLLRAQLHETMLPKCTPSVTETATLNHIQKPSKRAGPRPWLVAVLAHVR